MGSRYLDWKEDFRIMIEFNLTLSSSCNAPDRRALSSTARKKEQAF